MPKLTSNPQRQSKHLGNDSKFRLALAKVVVVNYFVICLLVFSMAVLGPLDFEDASELTRTWTFCIGPIVGTVVGYYFGGSLSTSKRSNGNRPLALIIALFYFVPTSIVTVLCAVWSDLYIKSARNFLEHWVLFSGPITGVVFGLYFSREFRVNDIDDSDADRNSHHESQTT